MTPMMRAGVSTPDGLAVREVPRPVPGDGQVLVRVAAAGLNRADLDAARGAGVADPKSLGRPIGMEWAGEVVETGTAVTGFRPGDRVMCSGSGGYAEYAVADMGRTLPLGGLDVRQAAVLPLALMTAHDALVTNGRLRAGEAVLVQGASSAVGLMALQIARLKGAAVIVGTSSDAERRGRLPGFGATLALDARQEGWTGEVLAATGGRGVDLVVDMVSGPLVNPTMTVTAVRGRMVNVGRLGGMTAAFDFDLHAARRIDYIGVTFRTRTVDEVRAIVHRVREDLWDAVQSGTLSLPIDRRFTLDDAPAAHAHMRANAHFGKILLTVP